ncbi:selenium cofactor biosynthesis protein YqeC [Romboutsia sedimentorum]|uniref:selenium cofactor biosynthesis protein YqeC n=1 Tax=Romboutsia sedimentorum TaxID=1368474 RepID=UPI0024DE8630|nr:selenium cofactor biosynthesis protein YqeC [Romboutsia sedimentorum]MDK2587303.1 selenium cofactor biosynthesis protein YqeC [Romboutsia sedimentorum]
MDFVDILQLNKHEVISVVGAGGKTSLINYIANRYRYNKKVLMTTTTKIYIPNKDVYDDMYMVGAKTGITIPKTVGVTVVGKYIRGEKIVGVNFEDLKELIPNFDLILIESDGSRRKKLKGWNNKEPVVYYNSTKTIGVLDITSYGMSIKDNNIHRLEELKKITDINNIKININNLVDIVLNKNGLFKNSYGERILFINKVENKANEEIAKILTHKINEHKHNLNIVYGSIKDDYFKIIKKNGR